MRLVVINCIFLACTATALEEDPRPRRHLGQIKNMIVNKLFSSEAPPPHVQFYKIPGFDDVVIKAVPKGSTPETIPVYEKIPPNSHIGIVGSYLGTSTLNDTYNALLGVKNLLTSGIISGKPEVLKEVGLFPSRSPIYAKPIKPCAAPAVSLHLKPLGVVVQPPRVPIFPARYSYKQVNQDGSLTTYTSSLGFDNGVRVTESGKTLPFIIDRIRNIPVHLPVPVLPEISKIVVSEMARPVTYAYQQIHQDGSITSYMGLPPTFSKPGSVVVTDTGIPPSPVFLMDRIEKVAAMASNPRGPYLNVAPKPVAVNAAIIRGPAVPGPIEYSYSQLNVDGGMTTHLASGLNGAVVVTDNGIPTGQINVPSAPGRNPTDHGAYSLSHGYADGKMSFSRVGGPPEPVHVVEHNPLPISVSPGLPLPPNSFSYKQIGEGKMTTYTGSSIYEERGATPAVVVSGFPHPIPPPHTADRIEKVAAGAKYNRPPLFAVPVPTAIASLPPVQPVKIPATPGGNSFNYRHVHSDGSVTSYGGSSLNIEQGRPIVPPANMAMPFPQGNVRVFDSPMYSGPFPANPVNPNAVKPSTPVSGSYSYKLLNSEQGRHPPVAPIDQPVVDTFAAPPPLSMPAPMIQGCIDEENASSAVHVNSPFNVTDPLMPVPLTYSYKQISHSNPNPFVVVNVEDPVRDVKKVNTMLQTDQGLPPLAPLVPPAPVYVEERQPTRFMPTPFVSVPIMPGPVLPIEASPPSSFSYKQVTSQANPSQPLPSPIVNVVEHSAPPMVDLRTPEIEKDTGSSSFSYKQVTNQGVFEYSDGFPTGVKTNLPSSPINHSENPGNYNVEQIPDQTAAIPTPVSPMSAPTIATQNPTASMPVPTSPVPIPSRSTPIINRRNSLTNNPIVVADTTPGSSFSFKSSNPDGSTITLKDDGHNSIAVELGEATNTETTSISQEPPVETETENYPPGTSKQQLTPVTEEGPVSGHARPMRRRVVRRKKPVVHRGDIPDSES